MRLRKSVSAYVAILAIVGGPWLTAHAAHAESVPAAVSQSSAYARVLHSVQNNMCAQGHPRDSIMVSEAGTVAGKPVYVISSQFAHPKCGVGDIAAVVADGHGGYHTALIEIGDELHILPDGRASVISDFSGDPGFRLIAYRFLGTSYRKTTSCSFGERAQSLAFAAGTSSGTVTGEVYPPGGLHTFDLFARAGQKISIEPHGFQGRVPSLSIIDSMCEHVVISKTPPWNGTLPTSGDFYITVSVPQNLRDQKLFNYSLTVTIK